MIKGPIAITPGEPAGVGPELLLTLAQDSFSHPLVAIADPALLEARAKQLGLEIQLNIYHPNQSVDYLPEGHLWVCPEPLCTPVQTGQLNRANAPYVLNCLTRAAHGCMQGEFSALVTGPLHKGIINQAGLPFTGHTEFLAELSHTPQVVMMLANSSLRVALVTTHKPLRAVSDAINASLLTQVIEVLQHDLQKRFALGKPRILVCGLNPHAGEGGYLGREEIEIIEPTLERLRTSHGWDLQGPLPADTLFQPKYLQQCDAVLAMYHDQGLPVLKSIGFGRSVNITLGLPFIRTSVDHGTALELAGTGQADPGSLRTAIEYAILMAENNDER